MGVDSVELSFKRKKKDLDKQLKIATQQNDTEALNRIMREKMRKDIIKLGYKISREKLIEDKDIIYTIIEFIPGVEKYDYKQIYFGPRLMENKDELFNDYYSKKLLKYENLLLQLPNNNIVSKLHHKKLIKILKEEVKVNE